MTNAPTKEYNIVMKKAIFMILALIAVAVFPAESFAGTSGSIVADCAFLLETPDDGSTLSAVFGVDICETPALTDNGVKFVSYLFSSDFPCFNKAADSTKLINAEKFFTAGISRSRYSVQIE